MMINKRLINMVESSKTPIKQTVLFQWISLLSNAVLIFSISHLLEKLIDRDLQSNDIVLLGSIAIVSILIRFIMTKASTKSSFKASENVKPILRNKIYTKLLKLGGAYHQKVSTSEVIQVAVEGVDQLETYFGKYLPQFFYSMLAPLTLFVLLSFISIKSAVILLLCVPLIPIAIIAIQKFAKKLLSKYWNSYTQLGDSFLENIQGLTTLKVYQADEAKNSEMNKKAENFRKITMKVLTMQLNSITIMDLVAYGGAAAGIIVSVSEFLAGNIQFAGCLTIILLAADYFIPLRMLGSYFHIAMNGMSAADKIFYLLDLEEAQKGSYILNPAHSFSFKATGLNFSYNDDRTILEDISLDIPNKSFVCLVGESGCGKSTIASLLSGRNTGYTGSLQLGGVELSDITESSLMRYLTIVDHNSYLFKGTIADNLHMARPDATEKYMWKALDLVNLSSFLKEREGLQTLLTEKAENLSGGQRQRLALARALLRNSPIYIFDEVTSNIDAESEQIIMDTILKLRKSKTVILISHRLSNVIKADCIYLLKKGNIIEHGTHLELLQQDGYYKTLYTEQQELEKYTREEAK